MKKPRVAIVTVIIKSWPAIMKSNCGCRSFRNNVCFVLRFVEYLGDWGWWWGDLSSSSSSHHSLGLDQVLLGSAGSSAEAFSRPWDSCEAPFMCLCAQRAGSLRWVFVVGRGHRAVAVLSSLVDVWILSRVKEMH